MLQRCMVVGILLLSTVVGYLVYEIRAQRQDYDTELRRMSAEMNLQDLPERSAGPAMGIEGTLDPAPPEQAYGDFSGRVLDANRLPLADVDVRIILKTWPGGKYRQRAIDVQTDKQGNFRLAKALPLGKQHAVHVAVFREGYAFESAYQLSSHRSGSEIQPVEFSLQPVQQVTLSIQNDAGRPLPNVALAPSARATLGGEEHNAYFQSAETLKLSSDEGGRVPLGWFARGDRAQLFIQLPGKNWEKREILLPENQDEILVTLPQSIAG